MPRKRHSARFLDSIRVTAGCIDCGTTEGRLDFDHRDKETKLFRISQYRDRLISRVIDEVMECDVRCAKCHTLKHWNEGEKEPPSGWKRPPCFCGKPSTARGMCQKHYTRWQRHGTPHIRHGKPAP
jgi:hypothetical protein